MGERNGVLKKRACREANLLRKVLKALRDEAARAEHPADALRRRVWALRAVMSGRGDQVLDLAKTNPLAR